MQLIENVSKNEIAVNDIYPDLHKTTHIDKETGFIFYDSHLYNRRKGVNHGHGRMIYAWSSVAEGCVNMQTFNSLKPLSDINDFGIRPPGATRYSLCPTHGGGKRHRWFAETKNGVFLLNWKYIYQGSEAFKIFQRSIETPQDNSGVDFTICTLIDKTFFYGPEEKCSTLTELEAKQRVTK